MITVPCIDVSAQTPSPHVCLAAIICQTFLLMYVFTHAKRPLLEKGIGDLCSDVVRDETNATKRTLHQAL